MKFIKVNGKSEGKAMMKSETFYPNKIRLDAGRTKTVFFKSAGFRFLGDIDRVI